MLWFPLDLKEDTIEYLHNIKTQNMDTDTR